MTRTRCAKTARLTPWIQKNVEILQYAWDSKVQKTVKILQVQYMDMIVDFPVVLERQVPTIRKVQNTQYLDRAMDVHGVAQHHVPRFPRRLLSGSAAGAVHRLIFLLCGRDRPDRRSCVSARRSSARHTVSSLMATTKAV